MKTKYLQKIKSNQILNKLKHLIIKKKIKQNNKERYNLNH